MSQNEDEWRPRSLQLMFGGGGEGGGGEGGGSDGGGGGYESGGATTGGGDWGSSGSYDASGMNAANADAYATALGDSPGGYFDTGGPGIAPGALGAEYGGGFGLSGISGQPGASTGAFGAEVDAGGGGTSGVGNAIASWGQSTAAGPPGAGSFADLSGGGFNGYTGYSSGGYEAGGGFGGGGFGGGGFGGYQAGGGTYGGGLGGYETGGGGFSGGGGFQPGGPGAGTYGLGIGSEGGQAGGGGGYESGYGESGGEPSGGPSDIGGDIGGGPASSDNLGAPAPSSGNVGTADTSSEDAPSADAPSAADTPAVEEATGSPSGQPTQAEEATGSPAGLPTQAEPVSGSPAGLPTQAEEVSGSPAGLPTQANDLPSTQDQTGFTTSLDDSVFEGAAPPPNSAWDSVSQAWDSVMSTTNQALDSVLSAITPTDNPNESLIESLTNPFVAATPAVTPDPFSLSSWFSPTTQQTLQSLFGGAFQESNSWVSPQSNTGTPWGPSNYNGPFGGPDIVGDRSPSVNWGAVFEGAQPSVNWGAVFEAPAQDVNWGSVFEGAAPSEPNWGSVFEGAPSEPNTPSIESFIPGGRETDFEYAPMAPSIEAFIPGGRETDFNYQSQPTTAPLNVELVPADQLPPGVANPLANPPQTETLPEINVTPNAPPVETVAEPPQQAPETGRPQEGRPQEGRPQEVPETGRPQEGRPQEAPQEGRPQEGRPQAPDVPQETRGDQQDNPPVNPNPAPPTERSGVGGQVTHGNLNPGTTRNQQITGELEGLLATLGRNTSVDIRVGSGGQPSTGGHRTGSHRHDVGRGAQNPLGAADVTFRDARDGHLLDARNPADLARLQEIAREAARLGATGIGFGLTYMGPNTMHIGGGPTATWGGAPWLSGAARQGMAARGRDPQQPRQAAVPLPRGRPSDAPALPPQEAPPRPPADIPPPAPVAPDVPRPPADIPAQTVPPAVAARTFQAAMQFGKFLADNLAKTGKLPANREEGQAALNALAHELARAGYPASVAQRTILETATQGSIKAGYGPNSNYNLLGHVTRAINEMAAQAMQGYRAGKTPEVQGPPAPAQQRSEAFRGVTPAGFFGPATRPGALDRPTGVSPVEEEMQFQGLAKDPSAQEMIEQFSPAPGDRHASSLQAPSLLQLVAGGRDAGQPPAVEPGQLPGRNEWESSRPGLPLGFDPNVLIENPGFSPPAPPPAFQAPSINDRGIAPDTFMMQQQEQQEYQQNLDPRGQRQASLLDFLSNLNPISTAEARGGRSQAGRLTAPQADPGVIQGRLAEARSNIINDLQNNQGLRNTLDLVAAGEVGSQGKAAVLAFLETAMNKVAAEASRQGREATGRDLLNYLNSRTYFPDTWGKIESGKVKGGAVTDDLLDAVAQGSNTTKGSTGNSSVKSPGSRFGGNPTNATIGGEHYGVENYSHHIGWYNALGAPPAGRGIGSDFAADPQDMPAAAAVPPAGLLDSLSTGR